jgi:hypothetical protein
MHHQASSINRSEACGSSSRLSDGLVEQERRKEVEEDMGSKKSVQKSERPTNGEMDRLNEPLDSIRTTSILPSSSLPQTLHRSTRQRSCSCLRALIDGRHYHPQRPTGVGRGTARASAVVCVLLALRRSEERWEGLMGLGE